MFYTKPLEISSKNKNTRARCFRRYLFERALFGWAGKFFLLMQWWKISQISLNLISCFLFVRLLLLFSLAFAGKTNSYLLFMMESGKSVKCSFLCWSKGERYDDMFLRSTQSKGERLSFYSFDNVSKWSQAKSLKKIQQVDLLKYWTKDFETFTVSVKV